MQIVNVQADRWISVLNALEDRCHELDEEGLKILSDARDAHDIDLSPEYEERRLKILELTEELDYWGDNSVEIDNDAMLSESEGNGCYVSAWVWCPFENTEFDKEPKTPIKDYHLKFVAEDEVVVHSKGATLVQALANLERALISQFGLEAAFENHGCFLNRDIATIVDDLDEVGGVFTCSDFSDSEGAFTITRLPL